MNPKSLRLTFVFFIHGVLISSLCFLLSSSQALAEKAPRFKVEDVYQAEDIVWGLCFLNPNEILFTQKKGRLSHLDLKTKKLTPITGLPEIQPRGQGGLMDVQAHPDFEKNSLIYFSYSAKNKENSWTTRIARARLEKSELKDLEILFTANVDSNKGEHFGSRIVFDGKGHIFFGIGDRGQRDLAQSLEYHNGKIIRLNENGSIPKDNPFLSTAKSRPEIWSYGHRNPQGMARHFETGEIWSNEHGPRGGDEINLILPGKNYGWPVVTFGREYWGPKIGEGTEKPGIENPFYQFTPSIAPSALLIYSGKIFPEWKGHFFSSALVMQHLNRLAVKDGKATQEEKMLRDLNERIRNVVESPAGQIYLSTDSGRILRLTTN